ncbi:enoyl-CoA hydratase-related protein [Rhodococcus koreensis]
MKSAIRWEQSDDGIVSLVLDDPDQPVNTVNTAYIQGLSDAIDRLEVESSSVTGVILRSAKRSFLAGGDLNRLLDADAAMLDDFVADIDMRKGLTLRLESLPLPVVAIVNGPALGGGLELALCCHHTIAIDDGKTVIGLPESRLGLMPGAGGIVRTVQRLGIDRALDDLILPGRKYLLAEAITLGLIDESAASTEDAVRAAEAWIAANPSGRRRTDTVSRGAARPLPAPRAVPVAAAVTRVANAALTAPTPEALHIESEEFGRVVVSDATKNALRMHFFATNALRKRAKALSTDPVDLADIPQDLRPAVRHAPDFVGDGQRFAEISWDGDESASAAASGLLRAGIVPILLSPGHEAFSHTMQTALALAVTEAEHNGSARADIESALYWSGLPGGSSIKAAQLREPATDDHIELACALLDRMASAGRSAVAAGVLAFVEDADAASVRVAGFPGWTGGIGTWLDGGRKMVENMPAGTLEDAR